ncbi:outer membrane protein assembly factor [Haloferula chungangensis]|uniref:Outer membrane protein assembly factor n=1 Tax=Haloferula chungangensis TaxID=1048331 RepID=A0ABW2L2Z1_9BACT
MRFLSTCLLFIASSIPMYGKTELRFEGMKSISKSDIERLIGGRFEHIKAQPASPARASDSAFMIEQLFRKNGFNDASVSWRILSPSLIRLRIDEGPRDTLGSIDIEGELDEELREKLKKLFELNPMKRQISSSGEPPFRESDIDDGIHLIKAELQSQGYWNPTVTVKDRKTNKISSATHILLHIDTGKLYRIATPTFSGEQASGTKNAVAPFINQTADTANINSVRLAVTEYYRSKGFVNATINMSLETQNGYVRPLFTIVEGKRFRLGNVAFDGLEKTNPERIRKRIEPLRNAYLDGNLVDKRTRQLIATGAFSSVQIETEEAGGDRLDATLHFEETDARGISLTAGFGTYEGSILGASFYDRNFGGELRNFSAGFEITQRSLLGDVSLTDPWLWGTDAKGTIRLYSLSRGNEGYDNWTTGLEGSVSYPLSDHYSLQASLGTALARTTTDGLPVARLGETEYNNNYLTFSQLIDYRDSAVLPTEGWYFESPLTVGIAAGEESTSYFGAGFQSSYYKPIGKVGQLALGARAEVIVPSGDQLPIDLRLFNGGPRSVRSYPERELGPHDRSGYPVGGEASWVANVEYIHPVAGALKGVAFLDFGGLSSDWQDFGMNEIDIALGLGIRFDLPIGPVRLEYGHNMTQDPGEPSGTWHFAIGTTF